MNKIMNVTAEGNLAQARRFLRGALPARLCVMCTEMVMGAAPERCPNCQVAGLMPIDDQLTQCVCDNLSVRPEQL